MIGLTGVHLLCNFDIFHSGQMSIFHCHFDILLSLSLSQMCLIVIFTSYDLASFLELSNKFNFLNSADVPKALELCTYTYTLHKAQH